MLNSDIYCQVSHIENSPNGVCEAMLLGIPVIASNAGGTTSLLKNDIEGIIVQEGEVFSLAGAFLELSQGFDRAKLYSENARKTALKRHDKSKTTDGLVKIYHTLI